NDTVHVLYHHNGVVHHNPQCQQEGEEHHHVQGKVQERHIDHHKGDEHGDGNGQRHEDGVHRAHEEHQYHGHQDETDDDGVDKIVQGNAGGFRLVRRDGHVQALRQVVRLHVVHDLEYFVGRIDQVFAAPLDDVQCNYAFSVQAGVAFLFFKSVYHFG